MKTKIYRLTFMLFGVMILTVTSVFIVQKLKGQYLKKRNEILLNN